MKKAILIISMFLIIGAAYAEVKSNAAASIAKNAAGDWGIVSLTNGQAILIDKETGLTFRTWPCPDTPDLYDKTKEPPPPLSEAFLQRYQNFFSACWKQMGIIKPASN